jgi:hypothetical protein
VAKSSESIVSVLTRACPSEKATAAAADIGSVVTHYRESFASDNSQVVHVVVVVLLSVMIIAMLLLRVCGVLN